MLKLLDVMSALEFELYGDHPEFEEVISKISIDTRTIEEGDLFIALKGPVFDGHDYIEEAIKKGAKAIIIDNPKYEKICSKHTYFIVEDSYKALQDIGKLYRQKTSKNTKVIAVTGSVGKTTFKTYLASLLQQFGECVKSPKNYNNHIGVPISLSYLQEDTNFGVFEVGMNQRGEIAPLSELLFPQVAVITHIGDAHIGNLGSQENIALEKADIFTGLEKNGLAFIPADTPFHHIFKEKAAQKMSSIFSVGYSEDADFRLLDCVFQENGMQVHAKLQGDDVNWFMPVFAEHYALLALFCVAVCSKLNITFEKLMPFLEKLEGLPGRGKILNFNVNGKNIKVIDDSYNASLASMYAGLSVLDRLGHGRKIAVLGEIKELEQFSKKSHEEIAEYINKLPLDKLFMVGGEMKHTVSALSKSINYDYANSIDALLQKIFNNLEDKDTLLLKGSNANQLWKVIDSLEKKIA